MVKSVPMVETDRIMVEEVVEAAYMLMRLLLREMAFFPQMAAIPVLPTAVLEVAGGLLFTGTMDLGTIRLTKCRYRLEPEQEARLMGVLPFLQMAPLYG
jgi:hypothetical protein